MSSAISQARKCLEKVNKAVDFLNESHEGQQTLDPILVRRATNERAERQIDAWRDLLVYYCRFFNKLKNGCKLGKAKGWFDRVLHEQRNDDLLGYCLHARNALEHGLEHGELLQRVRQEPIKCSIARHNGSVYQFLADPYLLFCKAVTDRGITYDPPTHYRGKKLAQTTIPFMSKHISVYLDEVLSQAEAVMDRKHGA